MSDTTVQVIFTETHWWAADYDPETAYALLNADDICDLAERYTDLKRANPYESPVEASLTAEPAEESPIYVGDMALDGTKPPAYYWTARKLVGDARYVLNCGRYREGNCREMDAVNAKLLAIEEELRLLGLAVDAQPPEATS